MGTVGKSRRSGDACRVRGTYAGHQRGFGFLVLQGGGPDLFVPPRQEGDAVDGDAVLAVRREDGTARVVEVLERSRPRLAGTYLGRGAFLPDAHRIPRILAVEGEAARGDKVLTDAWPLPLRIRRVLGRAGDPAVEDAAVLSELDIDPEFPGHVLGRAGRFREPGPAEFRGRLDLRGAPTVVTIDPVTSRDFDDAVSLEPENGGWRLGVHIADVSHYVPAGGALDREALRRGTSVYLPNQVIPMLPERLSNDLCSLREGVDRLAVSVLLHYDARGALRETVFARSVIRSDRRFSYERASRVMDRTVREKGDMSALLLDMARLARVLKRGRPSLDIPREEIELIFNGRGDVVDIRCTAQDVAHGVIEEFMLAANREVARLLLEQGRAALFRHHPPPGDLSGVWDALRQLGAATGRERSLRRAVARAVSAGQGPAVSAAMLRSMPQAAYTPRDATHFALGFEAYTHFTSPIRRYPDLTVHRVLADILAGNGGPLKRASPGRLQPPRPDAALEELARHVNSRMAAAARAESRFRRRRVLEFLLRLGNVPTQGQVTLVVDRGLLLDLPDYGASGFLPAEMLPGGPYRVDQGVLRGKRRAYRLGENLDVFVHRIEPASSQLGLALAPRF